MGTAPGTEDLSRRQRRKQRKRNEAAAKDQDKARKAGQKRERKEFRDRRRESRVERRRATAEARRAGVEASRAAAEAARDETREADRKDDRTIDAVRSAEAAETAYLAVIRDDWVPETARADRRLLLGAAAGGLTVALTGLVPTRISALGIDFSATERTSFLIVLAALAGYFQVAFWTRIAAAWGVHREVLLQAGRNLERSIKSVEGQEQTWDGVRPAMGRLSLVGAVVGGATGTIGRAARIRDAFDYLFPLLLGAAAIVVLVFEAAFLD